MSIIIEEHYAKEALRIMTDYQLLLGNIESLEKDIMSTKEILLNYQKDLENLKETNQPESFKEQELREIMIQYEKKINKMQDIMKPYIETYEGLSKSSHTLYGLLREKLPTISDEELKGYLNVAIQKIKNK